MLELSITHEWKHCSEVQAWNVWLYNEECKMKYIAYMLQKIKHFEYVNNKHTYEQSGVGAIWVDVKYPCVKSNGEARLVHDRANYLQ